MSSEIKLIPIEYDVPEESNNGPGRAAVDADQGLTKLGRVLMTLREIAKGNIPTRGVLSRYRW